MTMNEIINAVATACPGATMCRRSKQNFLAVPGDVVDGVQTYYAVKVSALLAKDTKTNTAFDFDSAVAEYDEYATKQAAKSSTLSVIFPRPRMPRRSSPPRWKPMVRSIF